MPLFTATFNAIAVTAAQDAFEITAPATSRVKIKEVRLGQYSDFGDAAAEILSVLIMRGHTASGSGGASVTPANLAGWTAAPAAASAVERNNTTPASGGSPVTLVADAFNIQQGWMWRAWEECEEIILEVGQRLVVRITAPADEVTANGTILFEEIGKPPTS